MKLLIILVALFALLSAQNLGSRIPLYHCMIRNQWMTSDRQCFRMLIQTDGNMVIFRNSDGRVNWTTATQGSGAQAVCLVNTGNLELMNSAWHTVWQTNTGSRGGHHAFLQDDGQLSVRTSTSAILWNSGRVMAC